MLGKVLFGINNIYTVRPDNGKDVLCRIKGKVLKGCDDMYNPITAGDVVEFEQGLITDLVPRKNAFTRWNRKRLTSQVIAANLDILCCVTASDEPPFRPRFLDKVIANSCCKYKDEYEIIIVLNKSDLGISNSVMERLDNYRKIGIKVFIVSAKNSDGLDELRSYTRGKTVAFAGQSGVGKSSLLNAFNSTLARRVGEVSKKYNRGTHVTNYAIFVPDEKYGGGIIDTPGIREIFVDNIEPSHLVLHFQEISQYYGKCAFSTCSHTVEKGCMVLEAVANGEILPDRYESYKRIYQELTEQSDIIYGKEYT